MNERVIKNPNFKNTGEFHRSLATKGKSTKDWLNTHTEVENLGKGKFAASIGIGHRVFFDKADGNKPKKHKLTDERSAKDYVLIQSAQCCVEVHPYYAKYFDVQHEEVRVEEERWAVQRLFKEPNEWRDVDAYNPVIVVEEYSEPAGDVVKVTVTYDTNYGTLTVEYFQRDGNILKHNVTFWNTSGSTETFRVLQKWDGIVASKYFTEGQRLSFTDDLNQTKVIEDSGGLVRGELADFAEMITESREPSQGTVFDRNGIRFLVENSVTHLFIDDVEAMYTNEKEMFRMATAVEKCPSNARVFIGGLGPGFILYILANSRKTQEIIVIEKDQRIIDEFAPILSQWFASHYPQINLQILQGEAEVEVSQHGKFDWIFMDISMWASLPYWREAKNELRNLSTLNLSASGVYTSYTDSELGEGFRSMRFKPVEVTTGASGLKTDFIYESWVLLSGEELIIDPAVATLNNPTEDGYVQKGNGDTPGCLASAPVRFNNQIAVSFGGEPGRHVYYAWRGYVEWDISALAWATIDANPDFKYEGFFVDAGNGEINPLLEEQPSSGGCTDLELWGYIASGVAYVDPFTVIFGPNQTQGLGAAARADLQTAVTAAQSWFALGFQSPDEECGAGGLWSSFYAEEFVGPPVPPPTLEITYTAGGPPGWTGKIAGVTNPAEIMGVAVANIAEVKGVA